MRFAERHDAVDALAFDGADKPLGNAFQCGLRAGNWTSCQRLEILHSLKIPSSRVKKGTAVLSRHGWASCKVRCGYLINVADARNESA